jgi:hypothetical protein
MRNQKEKLIDELKRKQKERTQRIQKYVEEIIKPMPREELVLTLDDLEELSGIDEEWIYHGGNRDLYGLYKWTAKVIDFRGIKAELYGQFWSSSLKVAMDSDNSKGGYEIYELNKWEIKGLIQDKQLKLYRFTNDLDPTDNYTPEYVIIPTHPPIQTEKYYIKDYWESWMWSHYICDSEINTKCLLKKYKKIK